MPPLPTRSFFVGFSRVYEPSIRTLITRVCSSISISQNGRPEGSQPRSICCASNSRWASSRNVCACEIAVLPLWIRKGRMTSKLNHRSSAWDSRLPLLFEQQRQPHSR